MTFLISYWYLLSKVWPYFEVRPHNTKGCFYQKAERQKHNATINLPLSDEVHFNKFIWLQYLRTTAYGHIQQMQHINILSNQQLWTQEKILVDLQHYRPYHLYKNSTTTNTTHSFCFLPIAVSTVCLQLCLFGNWLLLWNAFLVYWTITALYNTCHIPPFTHIHTLVAEVSMQGAYVRIRKDISTLPTLRCTSIHTLTHLGYSVMPKDICM